MYTLRFPFTLPQGKTIRIVEGTGEFDGLTFSLKKQDRYYVLTINGFPTEDTATHYINNVWAGLMWVLLHRGLPPDAIWQPQKVVYAKDPNQAAGDLGLKGPIDGFIDGAQPAVYPSDKHLRIVTAGQITPLQAYAADNVLNFFHEGIGFPESANVIDDAKLRIALELYGAYFTEISANAKFLTLVMALEALATGRPRTQLVLDLQDKWIRELEELEKNTIPDPADAASLEALKNDLQSRRENSLGRQIRNLVFRTLQDSGDEEAATMADKAKQVYGHRGTLVHQGKLNAQDLSEATSDTKNIVERVLRARFVQLANPGAN